jgi:hypothetical protein
MNARFDSPTSNRGFSKIEREEKELLMITLEDLKRQGGLTLSQAAALIGSFTGRKPSVSTCWRWMDKGVRGVKLDSVRIGSTLYTTNGAIRMFITTQSANMGQERVEVTQTSQAIQQQPKAVMSGSLAAAKQHLDEVVCGGSSHKQ